MKRQIVFTCRACGLQTPGIFDLPNPGPRNTGRRIVLSQDCHHCDARIERPFASLADLERESGPIETFSREDNHEKAT